MEKEKKKTLHCYSKSEFQSSSGCICIFLSNQTDFNKMGRKVPKVRNLPEEWDLQTRWMMPDMQPIVLAWIFSGAFSRRDDDDTVLFCLFISLSETVCVSVCGWRREWKSKRKTITFYFYFLLLGLKKGGFILLYYTNINRVE